jgi:short-subunit dehydrogenase
MIAKLNDMNSNINFFIVCIFLIQLFFILIAFLQGIYKYFLIYELDLPKRYGQHTWVVITGASSGQGRDFALEFAKRGFNILLIGSKRSQQTQLEIKQKYPSVDTMIIYKDFRKAFESDFFNDIEDAFKLLDTKISVLINNVAYRTGWKPYHQMPSELINDTISTGTIVQSRLTQIIIPNFIKRNKLGHKSALVNITAQCLHPNTLLGITMENEISVPYLSVYEAANAFGFYQGNSIYKEYKNQFDILNITPGAVVTKNTQYLKDTIFNIDSKQFVSQIIKMMGNIQGHTCAYWGHSLSNYLINFIPFFKNSILENVGHTIAKDYMKNYKTNIKKYEL